MAVGVLVLWRTIAWLLTAGEDGGPGRWQPSRFGDGLVATDTSATQCGGAPQQSGRAELIAVLANGWSHDAVADLADGVVLGAGEVALQRSTTHFSVWATRSTWLSHSRVRGWGRRVESSTGEVSVSGWQDHGEVSWLATSARLYGRARDGEIFSIWWACLDSLEVDLAVDRVVLGTDAWRAQLIGPGVAPIAVAAVAACHGTAALPAHPGLTRLQGPQD